MGFNIIHSILDLTFKTFQCQVKLFRITLVLLRPLDIDNGGCLTNNFVVIGMFKLLDLDLKVLLFKIVFLHLFFKTVNAVTKLFNFDFHFNLFWIILNEFIIC
jgi:hypothetical protein